jgi:ribose 5-phosphate isomerase B
MKVYLASDHAGFELKEKIEIFLKSSGYEVLDCGPHTYDAADDYPPLIAAAARQLSVDTQAGIDSKAIVLGASGQGEAMVANRFSGVRCAVYYGAPQGEQVDMSGKSLNMVQSTRAHNDANCLSLGARFLDDATAQKTVLEFLTTPFSNEQRHERRIKNIDTVR